MARGADSSTTPDRWPGETLGADLITVIAAMCTGADSIDDIRLLRSGGRRHLFDSIYAPSTVAELLRGHGFVPRAGRPKPIPLLRLKRLFE